jgi:hypothetical protein
MFLLILRNTNTFIPISHDHRSFSTKVFRSKSASENFFIALERRFKVCFTVSLNE